MADPKYDPDAGWAPGEFDRAQTEEAELRRRYGPGGLGPYPRHPTPTSAAAVPVAELRALLETWHRQAVSMDRRGLIWASVTTEKLRSDLAALLTRYTPEGE